MNLIASVKTAPARALTHRRSVRKRDPPKGTERIVLAQDDPGVRRATLLILEDLGYQVQAYSNGVEALAALEKDCSSVKLLLTDFEMPGLGLEAVTYPHNSRLSCALSLRAHAGCQSHEDLGH